MICRPRGKESTKVRITQNKGKEREKLIPKIEEISDGKTHTNTRKLIQNILMVTDAFLKQKSANVCEHMTKMASLESLFFIFL